MSYTDRELLEFAASAIGRDVDASILFTGGSNSWNPLEDDGDAFRLFVKLQMKVYTGEAYPWDSEVADYSIRFSAVCDEDEEPDSYAATRKAIIRAAAEIGRNMK